jgi:hypothetical protein
VKITDGGKDRTELCMKKVLFGVAVLLLTAMVFVGCASRARGGDILGTLSTIGISAEYEG